MNDEEKVFLEESNIKITNKRAVFGTQTYAMQNITSVSMEQKNASGCMPGLSGVFGLVFTIYGVMNLSGYHATGWGWLIFGVVLLIAAGVMLSSQKPSYIVKVGDASGSTNVYESGDQEFIQKVVKAVNDGMVG